MGDDVADLVADRQLAVERRRRVQRHQERAWAHPRDDAGRDLAHQHVRNRENHHVGGRDGAILGHGLDASRPEVRQPGLGNLDVVHVI